MALIYTHPDGRLRPLDDIRTLRRHAAICSTTEPSKFDRDVAFYCGSGWSTCYVPDAHAEGSTPGWRQEPNDNPIATGDG